MWPNYRFIAVVNLLQVNSFKFQREIEQAAIPTHQYPDYCTPFPPPCVCSGETKVVYIYMYRDVVSGVCMYRDVVSGVCMYRDVVSGLYRDVVSSVHELFCTCSVLTN